MCLVGQRVWIPHPLQCPSRLFTVFAQKDPTCWVYRKMALMEPKFRCFFTWLMVMIVSNLISGDSCRFLQQPEARTESAKGKEGHFYLLLVCCCSSSRMYFNNNTTTNNNGNQQEGGEVADGEEDGRNFWSSSSFSHLPMLFGCC